MIITDKRYKPINNGYIIYVDILTKENLLSIYVANMDLIYRPVRSSSMRGWDGVKRVDKGEPLFKTAESITELEYMKIRCNTQAIFYRFL